MSLAFILVLTLNVLTIMLSFVAVALAIIYPFAKRFTHLPQIFLGAAFSMAIPMGICGPGVEFAASFAGCCLALT